MLFVLAKVFLLDTQGRRNVLSYNFFGKQFLFIIIIVVTLHVDRCLVGLQSSIYVVYYSNNNNRR